MPRVKKVNGKSVQSVLNHLDDLRGRKVLIVGDVGLDEYVMGAVRRISPEAPVPVLEVENEESRLGMSANVAQNVMSLGGEAFLLSIVGNDMAADKIRKLLKDKNISPEYLVTDSSRPTTRKTRLMAQHHHVVRVDYEVRSFIHDSISAQLLKHADQLLEVCEGVIIQDYAKGVISRPLVKGIIDKAHKLGKRVLVDPHRTVPLSTYEGCDLLKPNFDEAMALTGMAFDSLRDKNEVVLRIGETLLEKAKAAQVVLTRGKEGMLLFAKDTVAHVPTFARQVFDVTGAGDTVIAALSMGLFAGWSLEQAAVLANYAAGVVVGKVGCVPCELNELQDYIEDHL